jgi:hypothetical protein
MKRHLLLACMALLAASLVVACGGDDDDSGSTSTSTAATATTARSEGTPAASATTAAKGSATPTSGPGGGQVSGSGADALRTLARSARDRTYQASYEFEGPVSDESQSGKGTFVILNKPPKAGMVFNSTRPDGTKEQFLTFSDETSSFFCSKKGDEGGQCIKLKAGQGNPLLDSFALKKIVDNVSDGEAAKVTEAKDQSIGGKDSKCFQVEDSLARGTACFAKDSGVVTLYEAKTEAGNTVRLKATKVSDSTDDNLLRVPDGWSVLDLSR